MAGTRVYSSGEKPATFMKRSMSAMVACLSQGSPEAAACPMLDATTSRYSGFASANATRSVKKSFATSIVNRISPPNFCRHCSS